MNELAKPKPPRSWAQKFADAFRGVALGVRGQSSFYVHFSVAALVIIAACALQITLVEWCLLLICIAIVLAAEMFNSALESLGKAIDTEHNPHLAKALDNSSAAVLVVSLGAATVGGIVFLYRLGHMLQWWT